MDVEPAIAELASLGEELQLSAIVKDQNQVAMSSASLDWSSSSTGVASVSATGLVTAVEDGTATVTASSGAAIGTAVVTVAQTPAVVTLTPDPLVLPGPGAEGELTALVVDAGASIVGGAVLSWSSGDEGVVTVTGAGTVAAIAAGTTEVSVTATAGGESLTQLAIVTVNPVLEVVTAALPPGVPDTEYGIVMLSATGGDETYAWALAPGSSPLPDGLNLAASGAITGVPSSTGTWTFTVEVTSGDGQSASRTLSIEVSATLAVGTISLPNGVEGVEYEGATLSAVGGDGTYIWTLVTGGGSLPDGMTLSSAGEVAGTPTAAGDWAFTVQVTSDGAIAQQALSIAVFVPLSVQTTALPTAVEGVDYGSVALAAQGGDGDLAWSLAQGSSPLPGGLTLSPAGNVSGIPNDVGAFDFVVEVTSGDGQAVERALTIDVFAPLLLSTGSLPDGIENVDYGPVGLAATGGDGAFGWALATGSGPLPTGLGLSVPGDITGLPTVLGSWDFVVEVTSGDGQAAQRALSILVRTPADPAMSLLTASNNVMPADGVTTVTITIEARDGGGSPLTTGGDHVEVSITHGSLGVMVDHGDGTYTTTVSSTTAGFAEVTGEISSIAMAARDSIYPVGQITTQEIVFDSDRNGARSVWAMNPDGSDPIEVIAMETSRLAAWSHDGTRLAFQGPGPDFDIWVLTVNGSELSRLESPGIDLVPRWSPDDSRIVFYSDRHPPWQIYAIDPDGTDETRLVTDGVDSRLPDWTPDGSQVISGHGADLWIVDADGANGEVFPVAGPNDWDPSFSQDGSRLVYRACGVGGTFPCDVAIADADGSNGVVLTSASGSEDNVGLGWSPTMDQILFHSTRDGVGEIYLMDPDGTNVENLSNSPGSEDFFPDWRPLDPATVANVNTSSVTAFPISIPADAASTSDVTVQLRNAFGGDLATGGASVELTTNLGSLGPVGDNGDGTYSALLTAGAVAGTATISATLNGQGVAAVAIVEVGP